MENARKKLHVRKGDTVLILVGKSEKDGGDRGKKGRVIATSPKKGRVVVENINIQKKHKKARSAQDTGGIIDVAGPIDVSNVQVVCPSCKKNTRVGKADEQKGGKTRRVRVCKKCGESLDRGGHQVKADKKKPAKAEIKEEKKAKTKTKKGEDN